MKRFAQTFVVAAALSGAAAGCVADDDTTVGEATEEIIGGFAARSAKLNAVGMLYNYYGYQPCTGTLISPTAVLTSKSCALRYGYQPSYFAMGPDAGNAQQIAYVRKVVTENTVAGGSQGLGLDLAIVHLQSAVTGIDALPVAELGADRLGSRMTAIGYGYQNESGTYGSRRAGSMTFKAVSGTPYQAAYGTVDNFLAKGAPKLFPGYDPVYYHDYLVDQYNNAYQLLSGFEAWFGAGDGDAQTYAGDEGAPITAQLNGKTTVFGIASWYLPNTAGGYAGGAFATINPTATNFISYELNCTDLPAGGQCEGNTAVRCATLEEGGYRQLRTDCASIGQMCAAEPSTGVVACVPDPCEGLDTIGRCNGDSIERCSGYAEGERRKLITSCADIGMTCGTDNSTGELACVDVP